MVELLPKLTIGEQTFLRKENDKCFKKNNYKWERCL